VPLTTFTILREPVERTLSFLRQRQQQTAKYRGLPLEDVYADPYLLHGLIHNYMVKVLTLTVEEMRHGVVTMVPFDDARLEHAKHNLEHRIEIFGLQEQFRDFIDHFWPPTSDGISLSGRPISAGRPRRRCWTSCGPGSPRTTPSMSSCTPLPRAS